MANPANPRGPLELPASLLHELKNIREMQDRLSLGIPQMVHTFKDITHGELQQHCGVSELMNKRAATLRTQLEKIDPTDFYEVCKKLWDIEWESKQLAALYRHQAYLFQIWLQGFREHAGKQTGAIHSLLNDPVFDPYFAPIRLPINGFYRNDPEATPYTTDYTQNFVGEDPLHTDAVELRRAPEPVDFSPVAPGLLGESPRVKFYGPSQGCRRRDREVVESINPALLQLRDAEELFGLT